MGWSGSRIRFFVVVGFLSCGDAKMIKGLLLYYAAPSVKHFFSSAETKDSVDSNND